MRCSSKAADHGRMPCCTVHLTMALLQTSVQQPAAQSATGRKVKGTNSPKTIMCLADNLSAPPDAQKDGLPIFYFTKI